MKMPTLSAALRTLSFSFLLLSASASFAQVANPNPPEKMTYQGYLTDSGGTPLGNAAPQNYDIIFRIFDAASSGSRLWSERQTVTIDKGYFSVLIGTGTGVSGEANAAASLSGIFHNATASDRFLELAVVGQGGGGDLIIQPRMQLLPSPYAFLAAKAQQLDASSTVTHRLNDQAIYLRTSPDLNNGLGYTTSFNGASLDGPKLFGNQSGVLGTMNGGEKAVLTWESNGRVGINKTTPASSALDVNGTVTASEFSGSGASLTGIPAGAVTSGTFNSARIPGLAASKITSGTLDNARLGSVVARTDISQSYTGTPTFDASLQLENSNYGLDVLSGVDLLPFTNLNHIVVHGYSGGVLGIERSTGEEGVLRWGFDEVDIYNSIRFQVDDLLLDDSNNEQSHRIFFDEVAGDQYGFSIVYAGEANPSFKGANMTIPENTFAIVRHDNSTNGSVALSIARDDGEVSVSGKISVGGVFHVGTGSVGSGTTAEITALSGHTRVLTLENSSGSDLFRFETDGKAFKTGGGNWSDFSDRRLKHNINNLTNALDRLMQLRSVTFEYNDPKRYGEGERTGFIAQEVEEVFPNWVHETSDGMKAITIYGFESLAVQALRELKTEQDSRIASLEKENARLRAQLEEQDRRLTRLERLGQSAKSIAGNN